MTQPTSWPEAWNAVSELLARASGPDLTLDHRHQLVASALSDLYPQIRSWTQEKWEDFWRRLYFSLQARPDEQLESVLSLLVAMKLVVSPWKLLGDTMASLNLRSRMGQTVTAHYLDETGQLWSFTFTVIGLTPGMEGREPAWVGRLSWGDRWVVIDYIQEVWQVLFIDYQPPLV